MSTLAHLHVASRDERVQFSGEALAQIVGDTLARRLCSADRGVSDDAEEMIVARFTRAIQREVRWVTSALHAGDAREERWSDAVHTFSVGAPVAVEAPAKRVRRRK